MDGYRRAALLLVGAVVIAGRGMPGWGAEPIIAQQNVGDRVHDFELPIVGTDQYLKLSDQYGTGPVVVVVLRGYPGYQCPLCVRQVATLANRSTALGKMAAKIILVYPGSSDSLARHAEQFAGARRLPEPMVIVRDDRMETVRQWGLRWDARNETAYPATYLVDRNGRIRWKKVSRSHAERSTVEEILKQLRKL